MDWLKDFESKFENCKDLMHIKENKLHGSIIINFADGIPHNCKLSFNLRGEKSNPNEGRME